MIGTDKEKARQKRLEEQRKFAQDMANNRA